VCSSDLVDNTFADKVFFCNSGAEANEAALKLARKVGLLSGSARKNKIIAFKNAFHGRTLFTVTAGGQPKYSQDFAPLPEGIHHLPFNDLDAVREAIDADTCAVIVEPIQGEGGVITASPEFLKGLRELCDQYGAVLIFDEVQTGVGRTGALYAYMNTDVTPDILTTTKALGGGFPIGAMITTDTFANMFVVGDHGTTYGGNPLACAVAIAALKVLKEENLAANAEAMGQLLRREIEKLNSPFISLVRGKGLLSAIVIKHHNPEAAWELCLAPKENGLLAKPTHGDKIRFAPPLLITKEQVMECVGIIEKSLRTLE